MLSWIFWLPVMSVIILRSSSACATTTTDHDARTGGVDVERGACRGVRSISMRLIAADSSSSMIESRIFQSSVRYCL